MNVYLFICMTKSVGTEWCLPVFSVICCYFKSANCVLLFVPNSGILILSILLVGTNQQIVFCYCSKFWYFDPFDPCGWYKSANCVLLFVPNSGISILAVP